MSKEVFSVLNGRILGREDYHVEYIDDKWAILRYRQERTFEIFKWVPDGMAHQTYCIDGRFYQYAYNFRHITPRWSHDTLESALAAIGLAPVEHFI